MIEQKIREILKQGEGLYNEFKESKKTLNKDIYDTVCAFLNRVGGNLLLGVRDDGTITGIEEDCVEQLKKESVFVTISSGKSLQIHLSIGSI